MQNEALALRRCPVCDGLTSMDRYGPGDTDPEMAINCEGECEGIFILPKIAAGDYDGLRAVWNRRSPLPPPPDRVP